ncbi:MAG: hypothetical protein AB7I01_01905 [Gammaproteobacteria bacterium]
MSRWPTIAALADTPAYREMSERLVAFQLELADLERRREDVIKGLAAPRNDAFEEAARARVFGGEERLLDVTRLRRDLTELNDAIELQRRTIEIHKRHMDDTRQQLGSALADKLRPAHEKHAREMAAAALAFAQLCEEERALFEGLHDAGYGMAGLQPFRPVWFGALNDSASRIRYWLEEVERQLGVPIGTLYRPR